MAPFYPWCVVYFYLSPNEPLRRWQTICFAIVILVFIVGFHSAGYHLISRGSRYYFLHGSSFMVLAVYFGLYFLSYFLWLIRVDYFTTCGFLFMAKHAVSHLTSMRNDCQSIEYLRGPSISPESITPADWHSSHALSFVPIFASCSS